MENLEKLKKKILKLGIHIRLDLDLNQDDTILVNCELMGHSLTGQVMITRKGSGATELEAVSKAFEQFKKASDDLY